MLTLPLSTMTHKMFNKDKFFSCSQLAGSVNRDVLCLPLKLEIGRHVVMHSSWTSSCQWLGTRAGLPNKVRYRNSGSLLDWGNPIL